MELLRDSMDFISNILQDGGNFGQLRFCHELRSAGIDLLAILQRAWIERYFHTFLFTRFDRVALGLLSLLCTFENSTKCSKISFDSDSFQNS